MLAEGRAADSKRASTGSARGWRTGQASGVTASRCRCAARAEACDWAAGIGIRGSSCMRAEDDGCGGMCSRMHAPEMRSAVSWSRSSAQEPGAAVRIPRLAGGQTSRASARDPDAAKSRTTSLFGRCFDRASAEEARTRPSRAFTRSAAGSRGHRSIGRSPNALLLLPTLERKSRCEARCVTRARSFLMEALGLPSRNVNLALNYRSRAGFTLQPRCCIGGDVIPSEAILL